MSSGNLFTVFAPSGAGKTSLVNALTQSSQTAVLSISHTTRPKRKGEVDGKDYYFVSEETFLTMVNRGEFLEHAKVFDNYYGTSQLAVEKQLKSGSDVILEIDWQGMQQIKHAKPDAISIFILPPSRKVLEQRLNDRGQDSKEVIAKRMATTQNEISHYVEADYLIVNDDFGQALSELQSVISSRRLSLEFQREIHAGLISDLLK